MVRRASCQARAPRVASSAASRVQTKTVSAGQPYAASSHVTSQPPTSRSASWGRPSQRRAQPGEAQCGSRCRSTVALSSPGPRAGAQHSAPAGGSIGAPAEAVRVPGRAGGVLLGQAAVAEDLSAVDCTTAVALHDEPVRPEHAPLVPLRPRRLILDWSSATPFSGERCARTALHTSTEGRSVIDSTSGTPQTTTSASHRAKHGRQASVRRPRARPARERVAGPGGERATLAMVGPGSNPPEDAIVPLASPTVCGGRIWDVSTWS